MTINTTKKHFYSYRITSSYVFFNNIKLFPPKQLPTKKKSAAVCVQRKHRLHLGGGNKSRGSFPPHFNIFLIIHHKKQTVAPDISTFSLHTESINKTQETIKEWISLTEDGKPGGTFRTFFVWMSVVEKQNKTIKQHMTVRQAERLSFLV